MVLAAYPTHLEPQTGRTIIDQTGAVVTVPLPFRGGVPLFQGIGEYLYVTRAPGSILDSQSISLEWLGRSFLLDLYPNLRTVRHDISLLDQQTANLERLLLLNPSAIFVYYGVAEHLRHAGLPALGLTQAWTTAQMFDRARVFAQALGQQDRVDDLVTRFRADIDATGRDLEHKLDTPRIAELFVLPFGLILMIGHAEADQDAFDAAGVMNASPYAHTARVGMEAVLRLDPASVLLLAAPSPSPALFMADPRWQALGAVRRHTVYRRPLGGNGGFEGVVEYPLFARWLAELSHPDRLQPRLRSQITSTIQDQFGYTLSDAQLDTFLNLNENLGSAGYDRFAAHAP